MKEGRHDFPTKSDMEIVKKFLKAHFNAEAEIKPYHQGNAFRVFDIFTIATKALNAKVVVELGTGGGASCRAFLTALKETGGKLYSVDKYGDEDSPRGKRVRDTIRRFAGEGRVTFIHGDAVEVGKTWDKGNIDILYCDDGHGYQEVLGQLEAWKRFNPKIIFVHDTVGHGGVLTGPYQAMKDYIEKYGKTFVNLFFSEGLGIIV